jgi:arylformamidase
VYDLEPLIMASFLNVDLKLDERRAARLSPAYMPPATRAPLITAVGGLESSEFKRQNARGRALRPTWADVPMPGRHHLSVIEGPPNRQSVVEPYGLCLAR